MESRIERLGHRVRLAGWCGLVLGLVVVLVLGALDADRVRDPVPVRAAHLLPTPMVHRADDSGLVAQPHGPDLAPVWALPAGEIEPRLAVESGGRLQQTLSDGAVVTFTLNPELQSAAKASLKNYKVERGAVVAVDPRTGEVLVYAEHAEGLDQRAHFPLDAEGPAASLFKLITATTLLEKGGLTPESTICTHGGLRRLTRRDLRSNPKRDTRCDTLARAFGASRNVAFARWADRLLEPDDLLQVAERFQFNRSIPFLWTMGASEARFHGGSRLEFARAAAGFRDTTLSPLHAALLVAAVANQGTMMAPRLVAHVERSGEILYEAKHAPVTQVTTPRTARDLTTLMVETVRSGTARKFFSGRKRLAHLEIAAKTGHLAATVDGRAVHYSWFMAFAPARRPEIAVAALVVLGEQWTVKGVIPARAVLEAWVRVPLADARASR